HDRPLGLAAGRPRLRRRGAASGSDLPRGLEGADGAPGALRARLREHAHGSVARGRAAPARSRVADDHRAHPPRARGRRPPARGPEALEGIVRIADHKNLEIAKDGLAMLAVTPLDLARKAIERFVNDPTTPRDRLELARGALQHHQQLAPKASKTTVSAVSL